MSGSYGSSHSRAELNPSQVIQLYNEGLPSALNTTFGMAPAAQQALATGAAGANPIYTASGLQQLQQYLPGYVQAGGQAAQQQATNTANIIGGAGGGAALTSEALNRAINPEFYGTRGTLADQTNRLFGSIGGPQLSPQEMAATERAVNQGNTASGNSGQFNPYNTVANAMNFGQALRQKQALIGNTIAQTTPLLGGLQNTNQSAGQFAMNAGNVAQNFGAGQFNPTQANQFTSLPINFGQGVFGSMADVGKTPEARTKNTSAGVANCCFIFMEAYHGNMPWTVRHCRDRYYKKFPQIAKGYKIMARFLVPLMKSSFFVRGFVWRAMILPLTKYGEFITRQSLEGRKYKWSRKFWFTIWNYLGR